MKLNESNSFLSLDGEKCPVKDFLILNPNVVLLCLFENWQAGTQNLCTRGVGGSILQPNLRPLAIREPVGRV